MSSQGQYWDDRIINWEKSAYSNQLLSKQSLLDTVATPFRKILDRRMRDAERLLSPVVSGKVVLDCGCGSGKMLRDLRVFNPERLIGVDIASSAVNYAKQYANQNGLSELMEFHCIDIRKDLSICKQADIVTGLGFIDYLAPEELSELLTALSEKMFLFSFPAKRVGVREMLHPIYLRLAHCPGAFKYTRAEMDRMLRAANIRSWWYYDRDQVRFVTNLPSELA